MGDLRCRLSEEARIEIKKLWNLGYTNYSYLGLKYGVHPKTIRKVIDDDYRKECNKFNRENRYRYKPSKEHHAELVRTYRRRKKDEKENS